MHWACAYFPQLALDAVRRCAAMAADDRPLALAAGPPQRRIVQACDPAAAAAGVTPGQPLAAAQALCGGLRVLPFQSAAGQALRELLAAWAYGYSSRVSLREPDALLLEVGGSARLFGDLPTLGPRLADGLEAFGLHWRLALAPTPLAASLLARSAQAATALAGASGCMALLQRLPLADCGLAPRLLATLQGSGIRTLGRLAALPRAALQRRFGAELPDWLERLDGRRPDPLPLYQPPPRFEARLEFAAPLHTVEALGFPLRRLLGDLCLYLQAHAAAVAAFALDLQHERGPASPVEVRLGAPRQTLADLWPLAQLHLARLQLRAPLAGLRLHADTLQSYAPATADLFQPGARGTALDWPGLRARLVARLGEDAVSTPAALPEHRPERAWQALAGPPLPLMPGQPPRPLWLLPRPTRLYDHGGRILSGPERIEAGWWDGFDVRRDYYVLETRLGQHAWVFRPVGHRYGPWLLHGWFA